MKRMLVLLFLTAKALAGPAPETNAPPMGTLAYMDWRNGFRDLHFGDVLSNRTDMVGSQSGDGGYLYHRTNEDLSFGSVRVTSILYIADSGKLNKVIISFPRKDRGKIRAIFIEAYGIPVANPSNLNGELWSGSKVSAFNWEDIEEGTASICIVSEYHGSEQSRLDRIAEVRDELAREKTEAAKAARGL